MLLVQDQNRFSKLVRQLVTTASIDVRATCPRLTLVVAGVRIAPRPFSKPIHVRGLDSLRSLRLESFDLPRECAPKKDGGIGIKVEGKGIVDGPATLELDFDEIAVDLLHSDSDVGAATIRGLQLRKGEPARFTVDGRLDATSSTRSARALSALMSQALADETGGVLTAQIRSFKLPSDARLPWLSEALERVPIAIPVTLPSSAAKELVQGMELGTTQLTFRGDNHFPAFTCDEVLIKVLSPFGFPLRVLRAWGALGLRWKGRLGGKIDLPELAVSGVDGKEPITGSDRRTTAKIGFSDAPLLDPSAEVLEDFARAVAASEEEMLGMDGSGLSIVVGTAAGDLTLSGIPLETEAKVQGLNGYRGGAAQLSDVRVAKGENDHLKVTMMAWFVSRRFLLDEKATLKRSTELAWATRHPCRKGHRAHVASGLFYAGHLHQRPGPRRLDRSSQPRPDLLHLARADPHPHRLRVCTAAGAVEAGGHPPLRLPLRPYLHPPHPRRRRERGAEGVEGGAQEHPPGRHPEADGRQDAAPERQRLARDPRRGQEHRLDVHHRQPVRAADAAEKGRRDRCVPFFSTFD